MAEYSVALLVGPKPPDELGKNIDDAIEELRHGKRMAFVTPSDSKSNDSIRAAYIESKPDYVIWTGDDDKEMPSILRELQKRVDVYKAIGGEFHQLWENQWTEQPARFLATRNIGDVGVDVEAPGGIGTSTCGDVGDN